MTKPLKTISLCAISLEINHLNVHCFTPVSMLHIIIVGKAKAVVYITGSQEYKCSQNPALLWDWNTFPTSINACHNVNAINLMPSYVKGSSYIRETPHCTLLIHPDNFKYEG